MSKEKKSKEVGVYAILSGEYYSRQPGKISVSMPYEVELQLTDNPDAKIPADGIVLSMCRNKLLPYYFKKQHRKDYPDFHGIRICQIDDIYVAKEEGKKTKKKKTATVEEMTIEQLLQFVFENGLHTDPSSFSSIGEARKAVISEFENKKLEEVAEKELQQERQKRKTEQFEDAQDILDFADKNSL